MTKYEQLIDYIINENEEKARELFHEIVVEKSREIYESMVDEEDNIEEMGDEISTEEEAFAEGEDEEDGGEIDAEGGDDADMDMDMGGDEEDHHADVGGEEELESKVMDLESELDELQAKFDELMGDDDMGGDDLGGDLGGNEMGDMGDDLGGEEEPMMEAEDDEDDKDEDEDEDEDEDDDKDDDKKVDESKKSSKKMTEAEWIREYIEKIGEPWPGNNSETGEVGKGGSANLNKQSIVAGKNDMGGTAQNIAKGGSESEPKGPTTTDSGLLKKGGEFVKDITNRPGGMKKSTAKTSNEPGHGAEKKSGPEGKTTGDSASVEKKSIIGSK